MQLKPDSKFYNLSEFKGRDVELYRSSDLKNTALYFPDDSTQDKYLSGEDVGEAFFELLRFELDGGDHQIYIRFPRSNFFVEMFGGFAGGRGDMKSSKFENIFAESYNKEYKFYSFEENAMLLMSGNELNFMKRVASYDKGNPYSSPYPNETFVNYPEIEKALSLQYLKIPDDIRKIQYCFKTKDETPIYFLVDYPAYNFKYDNHNFYLIKDGQAKEYKITNFSRYRDGGTTIIEVVDEHGFKHTFFSPTGLPQKVLCEKFDDTELVEVTDTEKDNLVALLGLKIEVPAEV